MSTKHASVSSPKRQPQAATKSKVNWLGPALLTVRVATASVETVPFPYVKGVFGTITTVLDAVEKVKKNRDVLKELCEDIAEITNIVRAKLSDDPHNGARELENQCKELDSILQGVLVAVQQMQKTQNFLKELFTTTAITDEISGYQNKIKKLLSNFMLVTAINTHNIVAETGVEVKEIYEMMKAEMTLSVPSLETVQSVNTCPLPSRIFHGRQAILDQMSDYFKQDDGNQHVYLFYGLGGSGKTQLALEFISQSGSHTTETIDSSLKSVAIMKSIGTTAKDALLWLTSKHDKWLLVFDNADDPKINLNTWLPQCNHGNIIITSRNPELHVYAGVSTLVSNMEETEAVVLLLKAAKQDMTPENEKIAAEIVKVSSHVDIK
ncbi:P-loop containing nucleoside triphosphate hydrolase protein [Mycena pura]|uniref:P-loop containing nucleoside triphosphate hydrolase protein n=1 Tax=Mycena pura TaxID=153505 RepID=A0AAD6Y5P1_9AGAR|nr:P-loop containing nucleoside triphosphate hydrolase protein [Mycena pura]